MFWSWWVVLLLSQELFGASLSISVALKNTVPKVHLIAVFGQHAVLDCSFPLGGPWDPGHNIITWQRDLEVVHSFYHNRDQLDGQSRRYVNRTTLDRSELARGNASLCLYPITPEDAGLYACIFSTPKGSQKKIFNLTFAAFYTEPKLQVTISHHGVDFLLTSQGYPMPIIQWLGENGEDVTNETVTHLHKDAHGLYAMSSRLTHEQKTNSNITFILRNEVLGQEMKREIELLSGHDHGRLRTGFILSIILIMLVTLMSLMIFCKRQSKSVVLRGEENALSNCHAG